MEYTTYWSIADTPSSSISSSTIGVIITLLGTAVWLIAVKFNWIKNAKDKPAIAWTGGIFAIIGLLMFILTKFIYPTNPKIAAARFLESPDLNKIEGSISQFKRSYRRTRSGTETIESFNIDTIAFAYGDALLGRFNGFSRTDNNVIVNGQRVKITYSPGSPYGKEYNTILRIEIGKRE
jgi:hypothetical protein